MSDGSSLRGRGGLGPPSAAAANSHHQDGRVPSAEGQEGGQHPDSLIHQGATLMAVVQLKSTLGFAFYDTFTAEVRAPPRTMHYDMHAHHVVPTPST